MLWGPGAVGAWCCRCLVLWGLVLLEPGAVVSGAVVSGAVGAWCSGD